eukprot:1160727-Pelagomonas_calceolata.AAC.33
MQAGDKRVAGELLYKYRPVVSVLLEIYCSNAGCMSLANQGGAVYAATHAPTHGHQISPAGERWHYDQGKFCLLIRDDARIKFGFYLLLRGDTRIVGRDPQQG